jgi:glycosyltransferase involved in cell wall biosynthesis
LDRYLDEAIESVENQSLPVKELIVVDDGSPEPLRVRDRWNAPGELIWVRTENRGLGAARNAGIQRATGEFIAFLDSDDFWEAAKIEQQEAFLDFHSNAVACYTQCGIAPGFFPFGPYPDPMLDRDALSGMLWHGQFFPPSSALVRSSVVKQVSGFREGLRNGEDLDFWFRLMEYGQIYGVSEPLTWYRQHESQITQDTIRRVMGSKESRRGIIEKYSHRLIAAGIPSDDLWCGYRSEIFSVYFRRDFLNARRLLWDYWKDHPMEWRTLMYWFITFLPSGFIKRIRDRQ